MREYESLIDGKLVPSSGGATVTTSVLGGGEPVSLVARAGARDVRRALDAARRAFDGRAWMSATQDARASVLLAVADALTERQAEIADLETAECGMPIRIASALSSAAIDRFRAAVERGPAEPRPFGVVAVRPAGDAPFARALEALASSLPTGDAVVLCGGIDAPSSTLELARTLWESDLPPGVVNVVCGGADAVEELASNPLADHVVFAGDVAGARRVAEIVAPSLRPASIAASVPGTAIVLDDADLDVAVPGVLFGAMFLSGRTHRPLARLLVHASIAEPFVHHLARGTSALRVGDPASFSTDLGRSPQRTLEAAERSIARAVQDGAVVASGGHRAGDASLAPTILAKVSPAMRIRGEHLEAPVLAATTYASVEEAVELANESTGDVAIWSRDADRAVAVARTLRAGRVWVNDYDPVAAASARARHDVVVADGAGAARARQALIGLDAVYGFDAPPYA
jgi:aldehyde dehydrogenase (NAD+)